MHSAREDRLPLMRHRVRPDGLPEFVREVYIAVATAFPVTPGCRELRVCWVRDLTEDPVRCRRFLDALTR